MSLDLINLRLTPQPPRRLARGLGASPRRYAEGLTTITVLSTGSRGGLRTAELRVAVLIAYSQ